MPADVFLENSAFLYWVIFSTIKKLNSACKVRSGFHKCLSGKSEQKIIMLRGFSLYYTEILKLNLPLSLLIGFMGLATGFITAFSYAFISAGFFLSVYFYHLRHRQTYYFYYNVGLSRWHLWGGSFLINLLIIFLLNLIPLSL